MGNKGHGRYWRVMSMGNTVISRGMGNKGKSPSHLKISFPTKKLPSALPHQGPATSYSMYSNEASQPEKPGKGKLDKGV